MKKILLSGIVFISTVSTVLGLGNGDRLDLAITPIRADITATPGQSTVGSVTLYNNSDQPYSFVMSAEDCSVTADYKAPLCNAPGTGSISANSLASWVSFDTTGLFSIAAKGNKTINYSIHTPANAIPGGHYGAIFFNSPDNNSSASISMNRRIGSLLLITVPGNIIVDPTFGSILIDTHGGASAGVPNTGRDFFNFNQSGSVADQLTQKGKQLMMVFTDPSIYQPILDTFNPLWSAPDLDPNTTFTTSLGLPVENKGTIHIVPEGKITLHETDGTQLTHIGKELVKNQNGVIVGEKIVDYLTINEEDGNVLPGTNRTFMMNWYGFARESILADGTIAINYETPGAYYSRIAREESGFLYPWEKLTLNHTVKSLTAHVDLSYINPVTLQNVVYNPQIPLTVEYDEIAKTWNTGIITPIVLIVLPLWWFIIWRRRDDDDGDITSGGDDEIAVLERARAVMFAREATRAAGTTKKTIAKKVPAKTSEKPTSSMVSAVPIKKTVVKKPITTEKAIPAKKTVVKKTPTTVSKEV